MGLKFSQLTDKAKCHAAHDYRKGLMEGREWSEDADDLPTIDECFDMCIDTESETLYSPTGEPLGEIDE